MVSGTVSTCVDRGLSSLVTVAANFFSTIPIHEVPSYPLVSLFSTASTVLLTVERGYSSLCPRDVLCTFPSTTRMEHNCVESFWAIATHEISTIFKKWWATCRREKSTSLARSAWVCMKRVKKKLYRTDRSPAVVVTRVSHHYSIHCVLLVQSLIYKSDNWYLFTREVTKHFFSFYILITGQVTSVLPNLCVSMSL
jgi:hypothetical protein